MKKILFILGWLLSLTLISLYTHENPEKIERMKNYFTKDKAPRLKAINWSAQDPIHRKPANSFIIEFSKVLSISERTAFIVHDENIKYFDKNS